MPWEHRRSLYGLDQNFFRIVFGDGSDWRSDRVCYCGGSILWTEHTRNDLILIIRPKWFHSITTIIFQLSFLSRSLETDCVISGVVYE